ncbi:uncharacterized protein LOC100832590 [Brachypodium distachyon]|uniref:Uncharacterized protein n=1 Tax=Brachypodium distachyon TaxID=15368 RepID=I1HA82_BRADI|nr:uncharacterized protein LOC100832590 [Brachypodium distachyon]KQK23869.1 hypothetical protein BRADI_1g76650v3 [Brachypodium distachyon]|eukprot:XP_003558913.1 uncharacterized protein LOC100832590 [Brachypodium distachyon]
MAEEFEMPEFNPRERVRQQISVPFLWEVKPGAPKRDWVISKPVSSVFSCPSPAKLVVSVPFQWEEKPGKPLQEASPLHVQSDHASFSVSSYSLNPFVAEGEEEYSLGFDLEAFGFPDDKKAPGTAEFTDESGRHGNWYSFSDSEDYNNSSGDTSAREFQFPRAPSEQSWEVANDDDQLTNLWSPPRSAFTLEELMMLSRKLGFVEQEFPVDVRKKSLSSLSSVELIKKFLIVCS